MLWVYPVMSGLMILFSQGIALLLRQTAGAVTLVPAFTGLGAPHWDREVRGVISQLDPDSDPARVARAAVDAVAHQVCDIVEVIDGDSPAPLASIRADGGMSSSALVMQTQADLLGRPAVTVADFARAHHDRLAPAGSRPGAGRPVTAGGLRP